MDSQSLITGKSMGPSWSWRILILYRLLAWKWFEGLTHNGSGRIGVTHTCFLGERLHILSTNSHVSFPRNMVVVRPGFNRPVIGAGHILQRSLLRYILWESCGRKCSAANTILSVRS